LGTVSLIETTVKRASVQSNQSSESSNARAMSRARFATERGRCACSLGVPVGTDGAAQ
jgi:hypothetical protein